MQCVQNYAQKLVTADRSSLFLVDTNTQEVYARIFDVGCDAGNSENYDEPKEIRLAEYKLSRQRACFLAKIFPRSSWQIYLTDK